MSGPALDDYVEVNERIAAFYAKYPEGSLQSRWELTTVGEQVLVVVTARAYRTPDDTRPGMGTAWEPYPGRTPFTKGSELMVGETSAWGRAIAALGFKVKRSVASAEEVRAKAETPKVDPDKAEMIEAAIKAQKLNYKQIDLLLGSAGLDALRARSPKALHERIRSLTVDEAAALEARFNDG